MLGAKVVPSGRVAGQRKGRQFATMAQFGLALGDPQLISRRLFILVIVLRPTYYKSSLAKTAHFGITTKFLSMALKVKFLPNRTTEGRAQNVCVSCCSPSTLTGQL